MWLSDYLVYFNTSSPEVLKKCYDNYKQFKFIKLLHVRIMMYRNSIAYKLIKLYFKNTSSGANHPSGLIYNVYTVDREIFINTRK